MRVTYEDILAAHERIRDGVMRTPCLRSDPLSELTGARIFVKMENMQRTGSFKERGARNALMQLAPESKANGVVAASAGNHALGLAYHGSLLHIPVTVVMPSSAPLIKKATCKHLGAEVLTCGDTFNDAFNRAQELVSERSLTYVHGYDDPAIIAGQGTAGVEIMEQIHERIGAYPDAIVVPIGGAGLIAGIAVAAKQISPSTRVYGVEPDRAATFIAAQRAGKPVHVDVGKTLADGLATPDVGANAFETASPLVDGVALVNEATVSLAVLRLMEYEKSVIEGAGAAGLAAMLARKERTLIDDGLPDLSGQVVALPLCGGNIDPAMIGRVIERGLAADGRLTRFVVSISDRPGGLNALTEIVARVGASVHDITHDRAFATSDLASVDVRCTIETSGPDHIQELLAALESEGFVIRIEHGRQRTIDL